VSFGNDDQTFCVAFAIRLVSDRSLCEAQFVFMK